MARPKSFDATTRRLIELDPSSWLRCAGIEPSGPARVISADLSTVTAEADAIIAVGDPATFLVHLEVQSSHDRTLPVRLLRYNVLTHYHHTLPVRSVAILLRSDADGPELTGRHEVANPDGTPYLQFRYDVVRVWQLDPDSLMRIGSGTMPLAPLTNAAFNRLQDVLDEIRTRLARELAPHQSAELWKATEILLNLLFIPEGDRPMLSDLNQTYDQGLFKKRFDEGRASGLAEGRTEGLRQSLAGQRDLIRRLGGRRFGKPDTTIITRLDAIEDSDQLNQIADRLFDATDWADLVPPSV